MTRFQTIAAIKAHRDRGHGDDLQIDHSLADGGGDGGADERAGQIEKGGQRDGLARRQDFGGDDGRDRVGGVVKAVDVLEGDRRDDNQEKEKHTTAAAALSVFQRRPAG